MYNVSEAVHTVPSCNDFELLVVGIKLLIEYSYFQQYPDMQIFRIFDLIFVAVTFCTKVSAHWTCLGARISATGVVSWNWTKTINKAVI